MATTESYVLKDGLLVPEEQLTAPITTRTNVSQIPKLDILFKPIVTDNIGNNVLPQANADIDWNLNLNIINVGGFRGFRKRRALRDALNANKNNLIWNGNGFQRVNTGLGADRWSRRDVRRLMRSYNDNWSTIDNTAPEEGNNTNYAAYLSLNYLANNPTATSFRWIVGKYPLKTVEELDNSLLANAGQRPINEPSFYGEMRNNLYDLTESANKEIFGSDGKKRDVASEFSANERVYEYAINKEKQRLLKLQESSKRQLLNNSDNANYIVAQPTYAPTDADKILSNYKNTNYNNGMILLVDENLARNAIKRYLPSVYGAINYIKDLITGKTNLQRQQLIELLNYGDVISDKVNHYLFESRTPVSGIMNTVFPAATGALIANELPLLLNNQNTNLPAIIDKQTGVIPTIKNMISEIFQQGGTIGLQESDKEEQLLQYALFSIIGANNDIDLNTAVSAIAEAYIKDPSSLTLVIQDENTIKLGMLKLELENPGSVKQITQPGFMKKVITNLISDIQQRVKQAKMGTKLDYIKQLKNICPEGYKIEFRKAGGSVCPVCKKKHKALKAEQGEKIEKDCGGGISKTMNSIKNAMKCGGKVKKGEEGIKAGAVKRVKSPKEQAIEKRDSLINAMNLNPTEATAIRLGKANQEVSRWSDTAEGDTLGKELNKKALEFMKNLKLKPVPNRLQK